MVWHAYLLNPRCFLEDCLRWGKMDWYATGLPWVAIDACIDNVTFEYNPPVHAQETFRSATQHTWSLLDGAPTKQYRCPGCRKINEFQWTEGSGYRNKGAFKPGRGLADENFVRHCECKYRFSMDVLRVLKFRKDLYRMSSKDIPLPGTLLNLNGQPAPTSNSDDGKKLFLHQYPNTLIKTRFRSGIIEATDPVLTMGDFSMADIRAILNTFPTYGKPCKEEKIALRKMMSCYWYNHTIFALDLTGAVIRQGSFVEKMHRIDWLHSPALLSTMSRFITKYERFFDIMTAYPSNVVCPTLDVDLAWHTHQISAQDYYVYSDSRTGKLIDHDDKIEETALNDAFAWTSKTYQSLYGEPYSECTCWYCEAVRESHTSSLDRVLKSQNHRANSILHGATTMPRNPGGYPHISAHNAVHDKAQRANARVQEARLDRNYHAACARARKNGYEEPDRKTYFASAWGYPAASPAYYPYVIDPEVNGGDDSVYSCDHSRVDSEAGAYGACISGTCGGTASWGGTACTNSGGACGGGDATWGAGGSLGGSRGSGGSGGSGGGGSWWKSGGSAGSRGFRSGGGGGGCGGGGGGCGGGGG
jgi:hypothetical protein